MTTTQTRTVELVVPGICCTECMQSVDIALRRAPGVQTLRILGAAEKVQVTYDDAMTTPEDVVRVIERVGHPVQSWRPACGRGEDTLDGDASGRQPDLGRETPVHVVRDHGFATLRLAFVGFVGLIALGEIAAESLGLFKGVEEHIPAPLALATVVIGGYPIFRGAILGLRARQINTDLVMSVGILAATAIHEFVSAALIVFFVIVAHYLEELTVGRSRRAMQDLLALVPRTARIKRAGGDEEVPVEALRPGDVVVVRPGERIAIDGRVASGRATVNQAAITGESMPVEKGQGDEVFAATVTEGGYLEIAVLAVGEDTTLGRIVHLVEEAEASKAPVQRFADRFSLVFLPVVLSLAALTYLVTHHTLAAVAVLVAACPCGVGLATPLSVVAAVGAGARRGLLIKGGLYLELLAKADTLVVDKTGTLTYGRPQVTDVVPFFGLDTDGDGLVALAAALEHYSEHPLARTVLTEATRRGLAPPPALDVELLPSRGLRGHVEGRALVLGTRRLLAEQGITLSADNEQTVAALEAEGKTVVLLAADGVLVGVLAAADTLRPEVAAAIARVRALGIRRVILLTGDNERVALAVAHQAGIDEVAANLLPEDKIATVRRLQGEGRRVIMVGDGINDAPALTQADVGIAMGVAGTDVALEAADVALMRDDWREVPAAIELGRRTYRTIRQNIFFGIGFNVLVIGLAAVSLIGPVIAAASQAVPDIAVALNASRLLSSPTQRGTPGSSTERPMVREEAA